MSLSIIESVNKFKIQPSPSVSHTPLQYYCISTSKKVWRQKNAKAKGKLETYEMKDVSPDSSFLEMLDILNDDLVQKNDSPVEFDHDCREGICGSCALHINGEPHGPGKRITTCQLHMRSFKDGETICIEPFRAAAFPIIKDLVVDRSSFDRIQHAGGYISVNTSGNTQDANAIPINKEAADEKKAKEDKMVKLE